MSETLTFITPDDWALCDYERLTAEQDTSEPGYTDDWVIISRDSEAVFRLHRDEIALLCAFCTEAGPA